MDAGSGTNCSPPRVQDAVQRRCHAVNATRNRLERTTVLASGGAPGTIRGPLMPPRPPYPGPIGTECACLRLRLASLRTSPRTVVPGNGLASWRRSLSPAASFSSPWSVTGCEAVAAGGQQRDSSIVRTRERGSRPDHQRRIRRVPSPARDRQTPVYSSHAAGTVAPGRTSYPQPRGRCTHRATRAAARSRRTLVCQTARIRASRCPPTAARAGSGTQNAM